MVTLKLVADNIRKTNNRSEWNKLPTNWPEPFSPLYQLSTNSHHLYRSDLCTDILLKLIGRWWSFTNVCMCVRVCTLHGKTHCDKWTHTNILTAVHESFHILKQIIVFQSIGFKKNKLGWHYFKKLNHQFKICIMQTQVQVQ